MEKLSNLQLELLKAYSRPISDEDLLSIRRMLADFFAKKAIDYANAAWDENGWTADDTERLMNEHLRKLPND